MVLLSWQEFVLMICLTVGYVEVDCFLGTLLPPVNLSLSWGQDSSILASWKEPPGLDSNCKVNYTLAIYKEKCPPQKNPSDQLRTEVLNMTYAINKETEVCVGISTNPMICNNRLASKEVYKNLQPSLALVENFRCAYYADKKMNCTWTIPRNTPDLQLFYREHNQKVLNSCTSYLTSGPKKTGCHLHDEILTIISKILFVFSGTVENHLIENKFMIEIRISVNPPKPKLRIHREGERLNFQAIILNNFLPPHCMKFKFVFTKCNKQTEETTMQHSLDMQYDSTCKYAARVQVIYSKYCGGDNDIGGDMSDQEYYGEDNDPTMTFKVGMIVIPLILCCCIVAAILIFRRIKHFILPKIPEPSLFFKDMLNGTSDGFSKSLGGGNLYVPVKETVVTTMILEPKSALIPQNPDVCT